MENQPKKSKALIITIIILLLIIGSIYLLIKNRDSFGTKTSETIGKIFSSLIPSSNTKNLNVLEDYPFLNKETGTCTNNATNPPLCSIGGDETCLNGSINPPLCSIGNDSKCLNENTNPPLCTINSNNKCWNGAVNPPLCTVSDSNKCLNGNTNPPLCTINSNNKCWNGAVNPPLCTTGNDNKCWNGAVNPPLCSINKNNECLNGANNPEDCDEFNDEEYNTDPVCDDDKDNDEDGAKDELDPNCHIDGDLEKDYVPNHYSETENPTGTTYPVCDDDKDNDGDGTKDEFDSNCHIDGDLEKEYVPNHYSETGMIPTPDGEEDPYDNWPECSDTKDNDGDTKTDEQDPNCHKDGDLEKDYVSTHDSETESPAGDPIVEETNKCKILEDNPLLFTPEEKAKLAQLLRKYYIIAPTIKNEGDITMIYNEMDSLDIKISEINDLTRQCYLQTYNESGYNNFKSRNPSLGLTDFANSSPNINYTGPKKVGGNPWFNNSERVSYLDPAAKSSSISKVVSTRPVCAGKIKIDEKDFTISWAGVGLAFLTGGSSVVWTLIYDIFNNTNAEDLNGKPCSEIKADSRFNCEYIKSKNTNKIYTTSCGWVGLDGSFNEGGYPITQRNGSYTTTEREYTGINDDYERILNVW